MEITYYIQHGAGQHQVEQETLRQRQATVGVQ